MGVVTPFIPAILGAAGTIGSAGIGAAVSSSNVSSTNDANLKAVALTNQANKDIAKENRDWSAEMQQQQNQFNMNMMNAMNDYNSPKSQVQRLQAAGLNPNMALGNTGNQVAPVVQTSLPQSSTPNMVAPQLANNASALGHLFGTISQSLGDLPKNIALAQQTESNVDKQRQETNSLKTYNDYQKAIFDMGLKVDEATLHRTYADVRQIDQNIEESKKRMDEINQHIANMSVEQKGMVIDNIYKDEIYQGELKKLAVEFHFTEAQTNYLLKSLPYQLLNIQADTNLKNSQAALSTAQIAEVDALTSLYREQTEGQSWQNCLNVMYGAQERSQGLELGTLQKKDLQYQTSTLNRVIDNGCKIVGAVGSVVSAGAMIKGAMNLGKPTITESGTMSPSGTRYNGTWSKTYKGK